MNKQEAIEKIKSEKILGGIDNYVLGYNEALDDAIYIVKQLNEPEKPVLTEEEAEWVDRLTDFYSLPDALYYITRCGYSHWFTFDFWGDTYELPIEEDTDYAELTIIKERLVNAVIYGYTVKEEKLYTAQLKSTGEYLRYDTDEDKVHHAFALDSVVKRCERYHFTKDTLVKYNAWESDAYDVNEVEE